MGRLNLFILIATIFIANNAFAATEKENNDSLRLETLFKEKEREEKSLHILTEELAFCTASSECSSKKIEEIKENIVASEDNLKFLTAEIQNARGETPQATRTKKPAEVGLQKDNRKWWDVYSRDKTIQ